MFGAVRRALGLTSLHPGYPWAGLCLTRSSGPEVPLDPKSRAIPQILTTSGGGKEKVE